MKTRKRDFNLSLFYWGIIWLGAVCYISWTDWFLNRKSNQHFMFLWHTPFFYCHTITDFLNLWHLRDSTDLSVITFSHIFFWERRKKLQDLLLIAVAYSRLALQVITRSCQNHFHKTRGWISLTLVWPYFQSRSTNSVFTIGTPIDNRSFMDLYLIWICS